MTIFSILCKSGLDAASDFTVNSIKCMTENIGTKFAVSGMLTKTSK